MVDLAGQILVLLTNYGLHLIVRFAVVQARIRM